MTAGDFIGGVFFFFLLLFLAARSTHKPQYQFVAPDPPSVAADGDGGIPNS
jgi:hypothetical protein